MLNYHVKVGLVPIRRDVTPRPGIFNWEKAEERCAAAVAYIEEHFTSENVSFVDLKGINAVDVLYSDKDVDAVIERFQAEKVDAVFLINGNFGNEEVAGAVAKAIGKPVLLWGPQDTVFEADGTRYTDSQCGLFGMSRQLQRMNVPFTYIENCRIEDPVFTEGFLRFVGVACAVKNFKGMRVAQVGMRPKPFCSVIFNESDLMDKFDIHVIPVNLAVIQDKYNRILEQKSRILKDHFENPGILEILPEYNTRLCQVGALLISYRARFYDSLGKAAANYHNQFSGGAENFTLSYKTVSTVVDPFAPIPELTQNLLDHLQSHSRAELETAQCLTGPHKDDFTVSLSGIDLKAYGSQGQTRTAAISLKLAQRELMAREWGEEPVLLLDDVLSELDPGRQDFVLNKIVSGQVFITCCEPGRFTKLGRTIQVENGSIVD